MNVLSTFDGMSCGRIALERSGKKITTYFASEVDKHAIKVAMTNYPDTVQLGDVTRVRVDQRGIWAGDNLVGPGIIPDLLMGGSPCQGFSVAGKGLKFNDPRSALILDYFRLLEECRKVNPGVKYLLENVPMAQDAETEISRRLGINPIKINSALVSAQNRVRLFWTNIGQVEVGLFSHAECGIPLPKDRGIILKDILQESVDEKYYLSEKALARIDRKIYSDPKINPIKAGTLNTKNNSGQLSVDSGTTLIQVGVVNDRGELREADEKAMAIDANFYKGMDNHGQRTMIKVHNTMPRTGGHKSGGTGPLSRDDGKTYVLASGNTKVNAVEITREVKQLNPSTESGGKQPYQQNRVYDANGLAPAVQAQLPKGSYQFQIDTPIRRLTPIECCRLQTVPDVVEIITLELCLDQAKTFVAVVQSNPKLLSYVSSVRERELPTLVSTVAQHFFTSRLPKESTVLQSANTPPQKGKMIVGSTSPEDRYLNVGSAERKTMSKNPGLEADSVDPSVFTISIEGRITTFGEEDLQARASSLILRNYGRKRLDWFGQEIGQRVKNASANTKKGNLDLTPTTLSHLSTPQAEQMLVISYFFAESVIALFTQRQTSPDSFYLKFRLRRNYFDGTGISETQQYKMLGNGWTVEVIAHILSYL